MAGPVKGQWGGEDVVLNDAATETTLLAILDAMKRLDKNQGSKSGGGTDTAKAAKNLASNLKDTSDNVKELGDTAKETSSKFGSFVSGTYGAIKGLGEELLIGGDRLSDFTKHITGAVSQLPVFGTAVGGLTQLFVSVLDNQIDVFRTLSSTGVDFGESLFGAQLAATKAGLTLETFGQVVGSNAETLAKFAGGAAEGARRFTEVSGVIQKKFGPQFSALGMTMEETAQFTADYMELQTTLGRRQKTDANAQAIETAEYIKNLDNLSKVTGKQRDQIADMLQAQAEDKRMKALLATMDEDARKNLMNMTATIESRSPELAEAFKELVATGGVPFSDMGKSLALQNPELVEAAKLARQGNLTEQQMQDVLAQSVKKSQERLKADGESLAVYAQMGETAFDATFALAAYGKTVDDLSEVQRRQMDLSNSGNKGLLDFQRAITQVRNTIFGALIESGIFDSLTESFGSLMETFGDEDFIEGLKSALSGLTESISHYTKFFGNVFSDFLGDLKNPDMSFSEALAAAWEKIKPEVVKGFNTIMDFLSPVFASIAEKLIPVLANAAKGALKNFWPEILVAGLAVIAGPAAIKALGAMVVKTLVPMLLKAVVALVGGPITIALGLLAAGIIAIFGWDKVKKFFIDSIEAIKSIPEKITNFFSESWSNVKTKIAEVWTGLTEGISSVFSGVTDFFTPVIDMISSVAETIGNLFAPVGDFFQPVTDMISSVAGMIEGVIEGIVNFFGNMIDNIPGMGGVKKAFGAVKGFFSSSEEEAEAQETQTLNRYEQIKARQERRRAVMENNGIAPEVSEQDAAHARSQAGNVADQMAGESDTIDKALNFTTAFDRALNSNSDTIDKALNATTAFDQALASTATSLQGTSSIMAEIKEKTARLREVDAEELSSYNREITRSLEEIKTQTGGGATVTNRDGTQTRIPGEDSISTKEQMELLNTNLSQLLAAAQEGNRLSGKQYQTLKQNTDSMW